MNNWSKNQQSTKYLFKTNSSESISKTPPLLGSSSFSVSSQPFKQIYIFSNTILVYPPMTIFIIIGMSRFCKCSSRVQGQSGLLSVLLSAHFWKVSRIYGFWQQINGQAWKNFIAFFSIRAHKVIKLCIFQQMYKTYMLYPWINKKRSLQKGNIFPNSYTVLQGLF